MEIPTVFKKLGLAEGHHIWLIDKALYMDLRVHHVIGAYIEMRRFLRSPGNESAMDAK